jgi:hypothetical protein
VEFINQENRPTKGVQSMKLFTKEVKKIVIGECLFHCIIDQTPTNESISFKIYPSKTKTSHFLILFSWKVNWSTNLCEPSVCARLIIYAIKNGWDYTKEKRVMKIEQGDFLINELRLNHN